MPRVRVTRRQARSRFALFVLSAVAFLYFVLPKLAGVGTTRRTASSAATAGGSRSASCSSCSRSRATSCCSVRCSCAGSEPDRLARELPDHDGRAGRDAAVRGRRRGRRGADRVGAAALGHGAAARGLPDGRVHRAAVRDLRGLAADRRHRAAARACFPGAARSRSRSSRRSSRRSLLGLAGAVALLPGDIERRLAAARRRAPGASRTGWRGRRPCRRWRRAACAPRSS